MPINHKGSLPFGAAPHHQPNSLLSINPKGNMMKRRLIKTVLGAMCAIAPLAAIPATTAQAQSIAPSKDIVLSIGRGELINVPGKMTDIFVSNEKVADVQVKSQRQLFVMGMSGGETTIYASNASGDIIWSANVRVGSNLDSIDQMLALAMPRAEISIATMGSNTVLLTGTVAAPEDAAEAERLVQAFVGESANVITRLKMATPLQVNLRVRIAEVSRSLVRAMGANLTSIDGTSGFQFGIGQGRSGFASTFTPNSATGTGNSVTVETASGETIAGTSIVPISAGTTLAAAGRLLGLDLGAALDLAETEGLVTTLSQPNLTALSGETAEFLAGGEFPIPLSQGLGSTTVEYKKYGVSLSYTPVVLANGRISMRVRPEVSELSSQGAVTLDGVQIPALTIRRTETTVELGSGQSMMIAGLLSNSSQSTVDKVPGMGDIPILGNLFKSNQYRKGETELVIIVTPYLVKPVDDREIKLPTDGYSAPNIGEQLLMNRSIGGTAGGERPMPRAEQQDPSNPQLSLSAQDGSQVAAAPTSEQTAEAPRPGFSLN